MRDKEGKHMKRIANLLTVLLIVYMAAGCAQQNQKQKEPIKIGYDMWPGYACLFIAEVQGYFREEGLDIKTVKYLNYLEALSAFANGELDGHLGVFSDTIVQASSGINVKSVFFTDASYGGDVIVAKEDIRIIGDLKGKKISVIGINSFSHIWILTLLQKNGLQEQDVQFANIDNSDVTKALSSGEIDAGHVYGPFIAEAVKAGYHVLSGATTKEVHGIIIDDLAFHSEIIKQRPDEVRKIVTALNRGVLFLRTYPKKAHGIISEELEMDIKDVKEYFQDAKIFDVEDNKLLMDKNTQNSIYKTGEIISTFLLKRGQLSQIPDINKIIETKFINELTK